MDLLDFFYARVLEHWSAPAHTTTSPLKLSSSMLLQRLHILQGLEKSTAEHIQPALWAPTLIEMDACLEALMDRQD